MTRIRQKSSSAAKLSLQFFCVWSCLAGVIGSLTDQLTSVVGSSLAAPNSGPFIVCLQKNGIHYCPGSLVNSNWAVTSALCLTDSARVLSSQMVAGSVSLASPAITIQTRSISKFLIHDPNTIGLVYTSKPFVWSEAVAPVSLPKSDVVPTGNALSYRWGKSAELQVANVPIISCHDTNICTEPLSGGVSACSGDLGSPLVQEDTLIGVASWKLSPCLQINGPAVYHSVTQFNFWIYDNAKQ